MSKSQPVHDAFRRWGYLQADLDWLGRLKQAEHPELAVSGAEEIRRYYCGTLAVEFMHIADPRRRTWIQERMESEPTAIDQRRIVDQLIRAATFEQLLQTRYLGNKRFSIEGLESLIPLLKESLTAASAGGATTAILAMSHRGRLNVMAHIVGKPYSQLMAGFEDVDPRSIMGAGDVKYHLGATGEFRTDSGDRIATHLVSNPSHLEAVNPVMMGRARAKQDRLGGGESARRSVFPLLIHGDAAFAGQGITAETLNLAEIDGYGVGGTVHVIANNLIGFTAEPPALHSSRFASDVAKRLPIPIFHVNAEDPDAVVRAARIATDYRYEFASDVVVDLIGYRRHGHSEIDDPTMTQPQLYATIQKRRPLWQDYAERAELPAEELDAVAKEIWDEISAAKDEAATLETAPLLRNLPDYWSGFSGGAHDSSLDDVTTAINNATAVELAEALTGPEEGFSVHPKVDRLLAQRREMALGERPVDFGMAEFFAYGSLLRQGIPVRISGQDSRRGTFSHRHFVLRDTETGAEYGLLHSQKVDEASFQIFDSPLSEAAVLGFEYGYSRDYPEALVAWEAQFGDFANGAQVIIDQFLAAGEDKWGLLSGLVVLLPHGFEGQGPEHSSARLERYLQLAAEDAIQVAQPSTAAQHFHLLRRQALRSWRKPLIVMTPKSMLRAAPATSKLSEFTSGRFQGVLADLHVTEADRVLLCSGKLAHELRHARAQRGADRVAIVTLEQFYPFPEQGLRAELDRLGEARDVVWVQEEPANHGALFFVVPRIERLTRGRAVRTIKRSASASPATGSLKAHQLEQKALIELAFS